MYVCMYGWMYVYIYIYIYDEPQIVGLLWIPRHEAPVAFLHLPGLLRTHDHEPGATVALVFCRAK